MTSQPEPRLSPDAAVYVRTVDGAVFAAQKGTQQADVLAADPELVQQPLR